MNLLELLSQIKDPRRAAGRRYPLSSILLITIMAIMSGYYGYREIAKYAEANKEFFLQFFPKKRKKLPSHVTIREVLRRIDYKELILLFESWALGYISIEKNEWFSVDGKAIGSTLTDYSKEYQNFISLVSVFSQKRGQVIVSEAYENKKTSEIPTVESLIERLDLKDVVFTLDALHCQKKL